MIRLLAWLGKKLHRHQYEPVFPVGWMRPGSIQWITHEWCPRCSKVRKI